MKENITYKLLKKEEITTEVKIMMSNLLVARTKTLDNRYKFINV